MKHIFVNLKRFDVTKNLGGICNMENPKQWIEWVISKSIQYGLGKLTDIEVTFLLPEALIIAAMDKLSTYPKDEIETIHLGCQSVFREDVVKGGNFGAFTTNLPAAAAKSIGCSWTIVGHSEERKDKLSIITKFQPEISNDIKLRRIASNTVSTIISEEALCALNKDIKVLVCVGETSEEKGEGTFQEQKPRIEAVLKEQLEISLRGLDTKQPQENIVLGYEPIWAIGPGKTPPGAEYISFVASYIKSVVSEQFGFDPIVVYGGGLKEENAGTISKIDSIDGGLVALTRFSGEIGFYPQELKKIIDKYME